MIQICHNCHRSFVTTTDAKYCPTCYALRTLAWYIGKLVQKVSNALYVICHPKEVHCVGR